MRIIPGNIQFYTGCSASLPGYSITLQYVFNFYALHYTPQWRQISFNKTTRTTILKIHVNTRMEIVCNII